MIYYNVYLADIKMSRLFNYINPIFWFNKIPIIKKFFSKHGVDDMDEFANGILNSPKSGSSIIVAEFFMGILLALLDDSILTIIEIIIGRSLILDVTETSSHFIIFLVILVCPTVLINNKLLFNNDKYLDYFKEFDVMPNKKKLAYGWLTFFAIIFIAVFFVSCFIIDTNNIKNK